MSELITIATFHFPTRAHVLKTRLSAEGIHVFLKNEMHAQVNNFQSQAIGGVQVQVLEKDLEQALKIAKEFGIDNENKTSLTDKLILKAYRLGESVKIYTHKPPLERLFILIGIVLGIVSIIALLLTAIFE
ncbi:MAG: DUF2007 domain-containing protein [Bacteroidia bacterium]